MLNIIELPQRGAGVTAGSEPKRASATLKIFFCQNSKVGMYGGGRSKRDRVVGGRWYRLDMYC